MNLPDTVEFAFFDTVWMAIDEDGEAPGRGQIIGILFKPGACMYHVQWSSSESEFHYAQELTRDRPQGFSL